MWMLALGGVFLATAQACVLCHLPDRDLAGRLAKLCSRVEARWKECRAAWSFPAFALDETSMNNVIEKTHRVLRVMEIKGSLSSLPLYRHWLQNTKLPAYTREALCAPACRGSTVVYNCSTCQELDVCCWPRKRCLPGSHDLWEARVLLLALLVAAFLLGVLSLMVESSYLEEKRTSEGFDGLPASSSKDHQPSTSTSLQGDQPAPSFQSPIPEVQPSRPRSPDVPLIPVSEGLLGPRHPTGNLLPSSPQLITQEQPAAGSRKLSTEGKNPLLATPPHPLLPVLGKQGPPAPEAPPGPLVTDWESGNECFGKLPPFRAETTSVSLLAGSPSI